MQNEKPEDHWRPGEPWRPRSEQAGPDQTSSDSGRETLATDSEPAPPPESSEARPASETQIIPSMPPRTPEREAVEPADRTVMMPAAPPPPSGIGSTSPPPPPSRHVREERVAPEPPRRRRPRRRRGRFVRRLLLLGIVVAALVALGLAWVDTRLDRVDTPSVAGGSGTYLIVGSDSRENLPDDLEGRFGSFAGQRADVIILARMSGGTVQMLSLPRDLKVDIPGHGTDKINAAYAFGGGDLLVQTVQDDLDIPVSHYMEVEFGGFASIVDSVGGVELTFDHPTRDQKTGLEIEAGTHVVDGATALAYVRSRSTEELRDGDWRSSDGGDIARTARQREALEGVLDKALSTSGILRVPALVPAATAALTVGDSTHSWNLAWFGGRFALASDSESMSLPVVISSEGGVSYVVQTEQAPAAIAAFVNGDPLPLPSDDE